ncbi:MAG: hypothetical protein K1X36_03365 [Pyrinomonadaceae bacterium]|nr:hypothetical protein [Pyrinomonadaceae bacterium]
MRASSGQSELEYRGYVFVKTGEGGDRKWSNYWNGSRRQCITVVTYNGRFDSIVDSPAFDCGRDGNNSSGSTSGSIVTVYEDYDLRGNSQSFSDGRYLNNRGQLGRLRNDRASSIDVPAGFSARLCDSEGSGYGSGACQVFSPGRHNLPFSLDNRVSYVEVSQVLWGGGTGPGVETPNVPGLGKTGATVYSDFNYRGRSQSFGPGRYLASDRQLGSLGNDEASSVVVTSGYRVKLCENEGAYGHGGGRCEEYGAGRFNLRYNDDVSYIEVSRSSSAAINLPGWIGSILKVNVSDLIGMRMFDGDTQMRNRGFKYVDVIRDPRTTYTIWWRSTSRQCVQVGVVNGRYYTVSDIGSHPKCY